MFYSIVGLAALFFIVFMFSVEDKLAEINKNLNRVANAIEKNFNKPSS